MHHSEQKCAHFCSEWCIVGYGTGASWDLWIRSILFGRVKIRGRSRFSNFISFYMRFISCLCNYVLLVSVTIILLIIYEIVIFVSLWKWSWLQLLFTVIVWWLTGNNLTLLWPCLVSNIFLIDRFRAHWRPVNGLTHWSSVAIWWSQSVSTLAKVMACCLTAPSYYLLPNYWLLISEILWHSSESGFAVTAQAKILYNEFENYTLKITVTQGPGS